METKLAQTEGFQENFRQAAVCEGTNPRNEWFSNILRRKIVTRAISLAGDAVAIVGAHMIAKILAMRLFHIPRVALNPPNYVMFYLPFFLVVLFVFERNRLPEFRRPEKELELVIKGVSLGFVLLVCANFVVFATGFSRYVLVIWYSLTVMLLLVVRYGLRLTYGVLWRRGIGQKKTMLIGSARRLFELQTLLSIQRYRGFELLGIVPAEDNVADKFESGLPVLASLGHWQDAAKEENVEQVIVAFEESSPNSHWLASEILRQCLADNIDVQVYSELFAAREFNYELDEFSGFFRFFSAPQWSTQAQMAAKAALDFAAGLFGSLIALMTVPLVGLAIKLEDGGPLFYRSAYVGPDGGNRYYLKFRTMRVDADAILERDPEFRRQFEAQCKVKGDPRVTRIGRFLRKYSVDEFPSFFSILLGHISLVGPRTIMQIQKEKYGARLPKLLSVKPGLSGFWQVMGRQLTTHEERVQMDMFYIDHWSIWLDFWIVAKTLVKVVKAEGAY